MTGYYADLPSNCRIYHNCDDQGNKFSYHCPEMTAFRQEALICDHAHLVDCQAGARVLKPPDTVEQIPLERRTTVSPFRDYLLGKESTIDGGLRKPNWPADVSFKNAENDSSFLRLKNLQQLPKGSETYSRTNWRQSVPQRELEAPFVESVFDKPTSPDYGDDGKTEFRGQERGESTTPQCVCKDVQTTDTTHFTLRNSPGVYPRSERGNSKSIETTPMTSSTSVIPFRDFTASLEPLVPNTLEYDPYYPKESWTTTETYYTPSEKGKVPQAFDSQNFQPPLVGIYFKIPDQLPDLNTLDDIVDRRKLFYIPKTNKL